jgi:hypothetical protein
MDWGFYLFLLFGGILVYFTIDRVPRDEASLEQSIDEFADLVFTMFLRWFGGAQSEGPQ